MERHKKEKRHRKSSPGIPIKTYRWEDIRRARLRGGYPWTHLYKDPFDEKTDPNPYKMDKKAKTKKGMAPKKPPNHLEIKEITNGAEEQNNKQDNLTPEPSGYVIITEVPSDSENHSKDKPSGSVTIEDIGEAEGVNVESAESSDNISQYLDKEEPTIEPVEVPTTKKEEEAKTDNGREARAKSEEPKRKRKLSMESSYSRKSLSKLAIMKKLRDAKEKIKIPKLNLPSLPNLSVLSNPLKHDTKSKPKDKNKPKDEKQSEKKEEIPKEVKSHSKSDPNAKPVYVHIPLKPPEGETDEFSYLEFGEKKPEEKPKPELKPEPQPEEPPKPPPFAPTIEISEAFDDQRRFSGDPDDIVAFEILKAESIDLDHATANGLQGGNDFLIIEQEDDAKSETRSMIIIMPGPDEPSLSRAGSRKGSPRPPPSRQGSKKSRAKSSEPESRQGRARSAEPERKRKLSVESSGSRRSLPKLGFLQKIKDAKDKFFTLSRGNSKKAPSKKAKDEGSKQVKDEGNVVKEQPKVEVKETGASSGLPKYIHIPLKPPPGVHDEFSYLEFEARKEEPKPTKPEPIKREEESSLDSPGSPKAEGLQFIFLTPPSDDEVLKEHEIPETPSSENSKAFFSSRVHELKEIAQDAVDSTSPKPTKKLQSVVEEEGADSTQPKTGTEPEPEAEKPKKKKAKGKKGKSDDEKDEKPEEEKKPETAEAKPEKMVVDEEDGLKLTESAMAKQEQNIKAKEVEQTEKGWKKKVSFKRRSKDESKDGDYEDIQAPEGEKPAEKGKTGEDQQSKLAVMGNSQSMSVEEEKSYLDEQKIIKSTSLEEDYNRWSKLSDHEYEPVNPPPDNVTPVTAAQPTVHTIDANRGQQKPTSLASSTTSLERRMLGAEGETSPEEAFTVQEMQTEIENKFFKQPEETPSKPQTTVHTVTTGSTSETQKTQSKKPEGPSKFQQAIKSQTDKLKVQTDKFKTKLHEMKKPNIKLPSRPTIKKPNLQKFKFEKPKINLPKIPDTAKITLPTFSLPRKNPLKRNLKQRQLSTESNAGGSKKNYFDFRTYPRLFKKKPKDDLESFSSKSEKEVPEFATVPRTKRNKVEEDRWGGRESIRIPLHPQESIEEPEREDSVERRMASHIRYDQDIDIDDAYEKENQEIHTASRFSHGFNSRWNHGSFHPSTHPESNGNSNSRNRQVTDLDSPEDGPAPHESFDTNTSKDIHSSESSLGIHRRGVLEEIDSDEFFLRQKGISNDNIEVGMYLSSEIREAFKSPTNALADLQRAPVDFSYDVRASNQSLPETPSKRKIVKKPKRKKTPHVSHEQISFDQDSELDTDLPPSRPKRRSRRNKKKESESMIPYQETIAVDVPQITVNVSQSSEDPEQFMYENEHMLGREQPEITLSYPFEEPDAKYDSEDEVFREEVAPAAPPRKHRSLKSLSYSEHDSILGDVDPDRDTLDDVEIYKKQHEYIIPTPENPPVKPARTLSRSSSKSREEFKEVEEVPTRPRRTSSQSRTRSHTDSLTFEEPEPEPCVEEPCVEDFRDCMGYAVIDKHTRREPPLPPPRTPPRRKRSVQSEEQKFFTVPRPLNNEAPMRPIRNYSTLGPCRPPRRKQPINMTDEEKENIDISQYIEIDEEPNRDLQSGDVIQKMRDRPLPAPPRPPRKTRNLHDMTSEENILGTSQEIIDEEQVEFLEEAEVSTQTEPLPDDFLCEEPIEEEIDVVLATNEPSVIEETDPTVIERRLITPTSYTYEEETITHGSLVVQPLNGAKILPDSELTRIRSTERIVPVTKDYDDEETSEIPEEFMRLKDPEPVQRSHQVTASGDRPSAQAAPPQPSVIERIIERPVLIQPDANTEVEVLKAQRLQVTDLDVDRLSVNELLASRIVVSEIDSGSIQAHEISSKSGALKVGEIELPPALIQQLFERLQSVAQEQQSSRQPDPSPAAETSKKEDSEDAGQKKTPFEQVIVETLPPPQRPPRKAEESYESSAPPIDALIEEPQVVDIERIESDSLNLSEAEEIRERVEPPEPPVRTDSSKRPPESEPEAILDTPQIEELQEQLPQRPPRNVEKAKTDDISQKERTPVDTREVVPERPVDVTMEQQRMIEPEIDDEPPPRPPQPQVDYIPSQPPPSFYALRAQQYVEGVEGDIPATPRRRRHQKPRISRSRSSSDESPAPPPSRRRYRSPEATIPQLAGQLMQACGSAADTSIKRLIAHITNNVLRNGDGQQDLHVIIVVLLVLVAGLILLGYGDGKTVHYHHWEFFNPPRDL